MLVGLLGKEKEQVDAKVASANVNDYDPNVGGNHVVYSSSDALNDG